MWSCFRKALRSGASTSFVRPSASRRRISRLSLRRVEKLELHGAREPAGRDEEPKPAAAVAVLHLVTEALQLRRADRLRPVLALDEDARALLGPQRDPSTRCVPRRRSLRACSCGAEKPSSKPADGRRGGAPSGPPAACPCGSGWARVWAAAQVCRISASVSSGDIPASRRARAVSTAFRSLGTRRASKSSSFWR